MFKAKKNPWSLKDSGAIDTYYGNCAVLFGSEFTVTIRREENRPIVIFRRLGRKAAP